jgi:hypothetical protein
MMPPSPRPGLVIRYSYLWASDHDEGREEGVKDRPCALVAAIKSEEEGKIRVLVLPITHSPPVTADAVEIPPVIKERLDLDSDRSWIVLSESNEFVWPGPDLRRVPGWEPSAIAYGMLPPNFFGVVRQRFIEVLRHGKSRRVPRTE